MSFPYAGCPRSQQAGRGFGISSVPPLRHNFALQNLIESAEPWVLGGMAVERADRLDGVKYFLDGGGWGVVRMSGTEPLLRMYAEAQDAEAVNRVLEDLTETLGL